MRKKTLTPADRARLYRTTLDRRVEARPGWIRTGAKCAVVLLGRDQVTTDPPWRAATISRVLKNDPDTVYVVLDPVNGQVFLGEEIRVSRAWIRERK